jgi:hypothetical protein
MKTARLLRTGLAAALVVAIMVVGSVVLWVATPLLWLWVGSQVQGATQSLGMALGAAFFGSVVTISLLAVVLCKLSNFHRANSIGRGRGDPGHVVLEGVLVISAATALAGFLVWFFVFAGADPIPLGMQL